MFSDLLDDDLLSGLPTPSILTKTMVNNNNNNNNYGNNSTGSVVLMQPKLESQPTTQTKMVPIAPRYDPNQQNSTVHICSHCTQPIHERYFLHTQDRLLRGNYWHMQCLRCQSCDAVLADLSSTFYTKDNILLCKSDYLKKYGSRPCSLCSQVIGTNEQIMRINPNYVYHLSCFICVKCQIPLVKGDRYVFFNGQPYCEKDNPLKTTTTTNSPVTKRGTTSKRGAKTSRAAATSAIQTQQTFITPPQYHHTGHISLLNNHHNTSSITHSLLSSNNNNNNNSSLIATPSGDDMY